MCSKILRIVPIVQTNNLRYITSSVPKTDQKLDDLNELFNVFQEEVNKTNKQNEKDELNEIINEMSLERINILTCQTN